MDTARSMSRLQRSSVSFRRQGSSGRIWDDPLRALELKQGPSPTAAAAVVTPLAPSPRAASSSLSSPRSFRCTHDGGDGGGGGGGIPESPESEVSTPAAAEPAAAVAGGRADNDDSAHRPERRNRRRRRLSSAFCACMGHPPASHAQQ